MSSLQSRPWRTIRVARTVGTASQRRAMPIQYTPTDADVSGEDWEAAVRYLLGRRARFVLCRDDKRPLWKKWQRRWPRLDEILDHWGPVGIVPASIRMSVLDADVIPNKACLAEVLRRFAVVAVLRSKKAYRAHLWMRDTIPRTNGKFSCFGVRGDLRSGSGYAILWGEAAIQLAAAIEMDLKTPGGRLHMGQMQEWIFTQGGRLKTARNPIRRKRGHGLKRGNRNRLTAGGMPRLSHLANAMVGERNDTLFHTLRHWAYGRRRGNEYAEWRGMVRDCAERLNREIPEPLPKDEVERTADSVADFCWTQLEEVKPRGGAVDREQQARLGRKSGQARRWASGHMRDHPRPWERHGICRSLYYARLKRFREENPDATGRPPDRIFRRCTAEEHRQQRVEAGRRSGASRRQAGRKGHHEVAERRVERAARTPVERAGRNPNHQQRAQRKGAGEAAQGRSRSAGQPPRGPRGAHTMEQWLESPRTPYQRERAAVAGLIQSLAPAGDTITRSEHGAEHRTAIPGDRGPERSPAGGRGGGGRPPDHRGRPGFGQDSGPHPPDRPADPVAPGTPGERGRHHVHQPGRPGDGRAPYGASGRPWDGGAGGHVPPVLRPAAAQQPGGGGTAGGLHHLRPGRPEDDGPAGGRPDRAAGTELGRRSADAGDLVGQGQPDRPGGLRARQPRLPGF